MKITLLREYIRLALNESSNSAPYDHLLTDDDAFTGRSILVPGDIKAKIADYFAKMGLSKK